MARLAVQFRGARQVTAVFLTRRATRTHRRQRPTAPRAHAAARHTCECGVCPACVAHEKFEEARFARHLDPGYYSRPGELHWESPLRGGVAVIRTESFVPQGY